MSGIAQELDETLRRIDPRAAARVTRLVRDILLAEAHADSPAPAGPVPDSADSLLELAALAEPMGRLTNEEIDLAIYGR